MNQFQSTKDIKLILMTNLEGSEYCNVWVARECRTLMHGDGKHKCMEIKSNQINLTFLIKGFPLR